MVALALLVLMLHGCIDNGMANVWAEMLLLLLDDYGIALPLAGWCSLVLPSSVLCYHYHLQPDSGMG
jgi:hypothetical protein